MIMRATTRCRRSTPTGMHSTHSTSNSCAIAGVARTGLCSQDSLQAMRLSCSCIRRMMTTTRGCLTRWWQKLRKGATSSAPAVSWLGAAWSIAPGSRHSLCAPAISRFTTSRGCRRTTPATAFGFSPNAAPWRKSQSSRPRLLLQHRTAGEVPPAGLAYR